MNKYNVSIQVAVPLGRVSVDDWFVRFRGIGCVEAPTAPHALYIAKRLGWREPVVSPISPEDPELPPLGAAPSAYSKLRRISEGTPVLPARYLRIPKGDWK